MYEILMHINNEIKANVLKKLVSKLNLLNKIRKYLLLLKKYTHKHLFLIIVSIVRKYVC